MLKINGGKEQVILIKGKIIARQDHTIKNVLKRSANRK